MNIHYTKHGALLGISTNMSAVPTVGDKIKIEGYIYRVKEIIWHLESIETWVEVLV